MRKLLFCAALLCCSIRLSPQSTTVPGEPAAYILFSAIERAEAELKINEIAARGYRLAGLQSTFGEKPLLTIVMEAVAASDPARYEYKLLEGHWWGTRRYPALLPQVNQAGAHGYRIVRGSLLFSPPESWSSHMNERALAMERIRGSSDLYEYRLVKREVRQHFLNDVQNVVHDGFEPILLQTMEVKYLLAEKGPHTAVPLDPGSPAREKGTQRVVNTLVWPGLMKSSQGRLLDVLEESDSHARENFEKKVTAGKHILLASTVSRLFGAVVADLSGVKPGVQVWASGTVGSHEIFSHSSAWADLEKRINDAAANGFVLAIAPAVSTEGNFSLSKYTTQALAVMEPAADDAKLRYRILRADTLPELSQALNEAAAQGWHMIPGLLYGDSIAFLQKPAEEKP